MSCKSILTSYSEQQRLKKLGIKKECSDFFQLLDILPPYIEKNRVVYDFCLNRRQFEASLSYSNRYNNYFIVYVDNEDWNDAAIKLIELLVNSGYNF